MKKSKRKPVRYSQQIPGDEGNYLWPVRFDRQSGYLGVSQGHEDGKLERVLLSARQVRELLKFLGATRKEQPHAKK